MSLLEKDAASPRRAFLGRLAGGAAVLGAVPLLASCEGKEEEEAMPPTANEPWLQGLTGKHKVVYDAPEVNDGFPLIFAYNYLETMGKAYSLKPEDTSVVVVLRHFGIPAAFSDAVWAKYKFGEMFKVTDPQTKKPALRNIFHQAKAGDMLIPDASFDKLAGRGVKFCVCGLALNFLAGKAAEAMKLPAADAATEWTAGLLPGAFVVPSGVLAVARAQEVECTYCFAG